MRPATASFAACRLDSISCGMQTQLPITSTQVTRSTRFLSCLQAFVEKLHDRKQHYVPIVDPGIKIDPGYSAYDRGLKGKVFINDLTGDPYVGQVVAACAISRSVFTVAVLRSTCVGLGMLLMPIFEKATIRKDRKAGWLPPVHLHVIVVLTCRCGPNSCTTRTSWTLVPTSTGTGSWPTFTARCPMTASGEALQLGLLWLMRGCCASECHQAEDC